MRLIFFDESGQPIIDRAKLFLDQLNIFLLVSESGAQNFSKTSIRSRINFNTLFSFQLINCGDCFAALCPCSLWG